MNLDGRWGVELEENLDRYDRAYPGRFFSFCHLDWRLLDEPDGAARLVESLRRSVDAGARGLKVWKDLGLTVTARDRRILPDDPLLAPVWTAAAELRIPVLVHVADPVAFFHPVDRHNERLEELLRDSKELEKPRGNQRVPSPARFLRARGRVTPGHLLRGCTRIARRELGPRIGMARPLSQPLYRHGRPRT